jgi:hypothetical protein
MRTYKLRIVSDIRQSQATEQGEFSHFHSKKYAAVSVRWCWLQASQSVQKSLRVDGFNE